MSSCSRAFVLDSLLANLIPRRRRIENKGLQVSADDAPDLPPLVIGDVNDFDRFSTT